MCNAEEEVEEVFAEDYDVEDELVTTSRHEPQTLEPMNQEVRTIREMILSETHQQRTRCD